MWADTVGACAWIEKELAELPEPAAKEEHASDEMYLGIYETAVEMHKEELLAAEEQEEQEDELEEDDEDEETP